MRRPRFFLVLGIIILLIGTFHFVRGKVDIMMIKAGNGELLFSFFPGMIGVEYFPEVYSDKLVRFRTGEYSGLPFLGPTDFHDLSENHYPKRLRGYLFYYSFNGPWPHKTISIGIPIWVILLLSAVGVATGKLAAESGRSRD